MLMDFVETYRDIGQETSFHVGEGNAVDGPDAVGAGEPERDSGIGRRRGEGHVTEVSRHYRGIWCRSLLCNHEAHDFVDVVVVGICSNTADLANDVLQIDSLAGKIREIKDNLITLGHGDVHLSDLGRVLQKARIRSNDLERDGGGGILSVNEVETV